MVSYHKNITLLLLMIFLFVNSISASIVSIVPDSAEQGQQFTVSITGQGTTFYIQQGSFTLSNINRIYLQQDSTTIPGTDISYSSQINCGARFTLENNSPLGLYTVAVEQNSGGTHTLADGFTIIPRDTTPRIKSIAPDNAELGETLSVVITGKFTNFMKGQVSRDTGTNVSAVYLQQDSTKVNADTFQVTDDTLLDATFSFSGDTTIGLYDVVVIQDTPTDTIRIINLIDGFTLYPPDTLQEMVAHWDFNNINGDTLLDLSSNNNHGKIHGGEWEFDPLTKGALRLDGIDDYIKIPHSSSLDLTKNITMTAWVRPVGTTDYCSAIVGKGESVSPAQWYGSYWLPMHGKDRLTWGFTVCTNPGANDHWSPVKAPTNKWNFLSATFDNRKDEVKLYFDGELVSTDEETNSLTSNNLAVHIGRNNDFTNMRYFNGFVGDVALYNFVLSPDSIKSLFESFSIYDTVYKIAHWKFNEGNDDTAYDESVFKNDVKLLDGADWVDGINGKAIEFDGLDDKGLCADKECQSGWKALTIEAVIWLNDYPDSGKFGPIIGKWGLGSNSDHSWGINISNDTVRGIHGAIHGINGSSVGTTVEHIYGTVTIPVKKWTHVVYTWEDTVMNLYFNGNKTDSKTITSIGTIWDSQSELRLGHSHNLKQEYFNGIIDELIIYNYALSSDTIKAHYANFIPVGNSFTQIKAKTACYKKFTKGYIIYNNKRLPLSVALFDIQGRLILNKNYQNSQRVVYFNIDKFARGIYLLRIKLGSEAITRPIVHYD